MSRFIDPKALKAEASELADDVLGHLVTLSEGWTMGDFQIRRDSMRRIARIVRAQFEHELNQLSERDLES